ncbi:hypothetical protein FRC11_003675 [Ceratobasidium sp. 423]|nr:hypothetical protein FRC11_003675 [Ceratobasidium sp. 423]
MPVPDFAIPTGEIFNSAFQLADQNAGLLVHCGAGFGRTGTAITAIQLLNLSGTTPERAALFSDMMH